MRCPFFEEVVVAFCRAYPVKKMVPSDRVQADSICTCERFDECSLFREVMARLDDGKGSAGDSATNDAGGTKPQGD